MRNCVVQRTLLSIACAKPPKAPWNTVVFQVFKCSRCSNRKHQLFPSEQLNQDSIFGAAVGCAAHRPLCPRQVDLAMRAAAAVSKPESWECTLRASVAGAAPIRGSTQGPCPERAAAGAHSRVSSRSASAATCSWPHVIAAKMRTTAPADDTSHFRLHFLEASVGRTLKVFSRYCNQAGGLVWAPDSLARLTTEWSPLSIHIDLKTVLHLFDLPTILMSVQGPISARVWPGRLTSVWSQDLTSLSVNG